MTTSRKLPESGSIDAAAVTPEGVQDAHVASSEMVGISRDVDARVASALAVPESREQDLMQLITVDEAREILGPGLFFGPEALAQSLPSYAPDVERSKSVPFRLTLGEALAAKKYNQAVFFHTSAIPDVTYCVDGIDSLPDSSSLHCLQGRLGMDRKALVHLGGSWDFEGQSFTHIPDRDEWRMTSLEPIRFSEDKNVVQHLEMVVDFLRTRFYAEIPMPTLVEEAIQEFELSKQGLLASMETRSYKDFINAILSLKFAKMTLPTLPSLVQEVVMARSAGVAMLKDVFVMTSTPCDEIPSALVSLGWGGRSQGVMLRSISPFHARENHAAFISRSLSY